MITIDKIINAAYGTTFGTAQIDIDSPNQILLIWFTLSTSAVSVSGVKFNGNDGVQLGQTGATNQSLELWWYKNPSVGSYLLDTAIGPGATYSICAMVISGVSKTGNPLILTDSGTLVSNSILNFNQPDNANLMIDMVSAATSTTPRVDQTQFYRVTSPKITVGSYKYGGINMFHTYSANTANAHLGVLLRPAQEGSIWFPESTTRSRDDPVRTNGLNNRTTPTNGIWGYKAARFYENSFFHTVGRLFVPPSVPVVTSDGITALANDYATASGTVSNDGGAAITERGIVWSTSSNPTTADNKVTVAGTTGSFTGDITGLLSNTTYHYRAYATNYVGTSYGVDVQFTTPVPTYFHLNSPIRIQNVTTGQTTAKPYSFEHVVSEQNSVLIVFATAKAGVMFSWPEDSLTLNGGFIPQIRSHNDGTAGWGEGVWYLTNPPIGSNTITLNPTSSSPNSIQVTAISLTGVDVTDTSPFGQLISATASNTYSTTVTTQFPGSLVLSMKQFSSTKDIKIDNPQEIKLVEQTTPSKNTFHASYLYTNPSDQWMSYTFSGSNTLVYGWFIVLRPNKMSSPWFPDVGVHSTDDLVRSNGFNTGDFQELHATSGSISTLFKSSFFHTIGRLLGIENTGVKAQVSDSVSITESVALKREYNVNVSESIHVAESVTFDGVPNPNVSETITVTEAIKMLLESFVNVSDGITVSENAVVALQGTTDLLVNVNDTISTTEAKQMMLESFINTSDSISVAESVNLAVSPPQVAVSDTIDSTEATSVLRVSDVNVSDSITLTESVAMFVDLNISKSETITVTDTPNIAKVNDFNVSDSITVSEAKSVDLQITPSVNEAIVLSENVKVDLEINKAVSDTIGTTESIQVLRISDINVSETINTAESTTLVDSDPQVTVNDPISVTDSPVVVLLGVALNPYTSDSITVSDSVNLTVSAPQISVSDSIIVSEFVDPELENNISVEDDIEITEDTHVDRNNQVNVYEILNVAESTAVFLTISISVSDNISLAETVAVVDSDPQVTTSDSITVSESVVLKLSDAEINVLDSISLLENVNAILESYINVSDAISVSEFVNIAKVNDINVNDAITVDESVNIALVHTLSVNDSITVSEAKNVKVSDPQVIVSDSVSITEALAFTFVHFINVSDAITVNDVVADITPPHVPDYIFPKLIMIEGRLAYLIVPSIGIPQYIYIT